MGEAYAGYCRVEPNRVSPRLERAERDQSDGDKGWGERERLASVLPQRKWSRDFLEEVLVFILLGLLASYSFSDR